MFGISSSTSSFLSCNLHSAYFYWIFVLYFLFIFALVLPMFVNNDIRKEMYKGADANVDAQFKKLYIYHMENVSILFADIKVSQYYIHNTKAYRFYCTHILCYIAHEKEKKIYKINKCKKINSFHSLSNLNP